MSRSLKSRMTLVFIAVLASIMLSMGAVFAQAADDSGDTPSTATVRLAAVEVSQNNGWVVTDATKTLNSAEIWSKMFTVKATYAKKSTTTADDGTTTDVWTNEDPVTLEFTSFSGTNATAATGEKVAFSFDTAGNFVATVTPKSGAVVDPADTTVTTLDGSVAYSTGTASPNGIWALYDGDATGLTTTSAIPMDNIHVYYTYNDGTKEEGSAISGSYYDFSGNLFPYDFNKTFGANEDTTAQVTVTLKAGMLSQINGDGRSTTVKIEHVAFVVPVGIDSINAPDILSTQVARSAFDYSGISVGIKLSKNGRPITVPINAFKNHLDFNTIVKNTYYDRDDFNETNEQDHIVNSLSLSAKFVKITFTYPGLSSVDSYLCPITVAPIAINTPTFTYYEQEQTKDGQKIVILDYTTDLAVTPTLPDYSQYTNNGGEPFVTFDIISTLAENVGYEKIDNNGYKFLRPGTFAITATLGTETAANADFVWGMPTGGGDRGSNQTNSKELTYTLQIDKSKIEIEAGNITAFAYTYKTEPDTSTDYKKELSAKETETGHTLETKFSLDEFVPSTDDTGSRFRYEYFDALTEDGEVPETRDLTAPTTVGHYYAVAVTQENLYCLSAMSEPVVVTVNPAEIQADSTGGILKEGIVYKRGVSYGIGDVMKTDISTDIKNMITVSKVNGSATDKVTYYQVGGYDVELSISNTNYVWKGSGWNGADVEWTKAEDLNTYRTTTDAKFVIGQRTIQYTINAPDFYYGAAIANSGSYNATESGIPTGDGTITLKKSYNTTQDASDLSKWNVGTYKVTYTPSYGTPIPTANVHAAQEKASLAFTATSATFTIKKAQITKVSGGGTHTYKADGNVVTINDWVKIANGGQGAITELKNVLSLSMKFKYDEDGAAETDFTPERSGENDNSLKLTNAGTYTATVSIADKTNFEWVGSTADNSDVADITLEWKVNRAEVGYQFCAAGITTPTEDDWKNDTRADAMYAGITAGATQPLPTFRFLDQTGAPLGNTYTIYSYESEKYVEAITAVGQYLFTFALDATVKNYTIPQSGQNFWYTITAQGIARITTKDLTAMFSGETFDFTEYVNVPDGKPYADVYEGRVSIDIQTNGAKADLRDAGTYTVTISLADGFTWADGAGDLPIEFTFTVNKLEVEYTLSDLTADYDGATHVPTVTFTNNKDGDAASLVVKVGGAASQTNANHYAITLELGGAKKDNYEITTQPTDEFYIYKQVVAKPQKGADVTYNGAAQSVQYTNGGDWRDLTGIATVEIVGTNANSQTVIGTFDLTNGQLSVTHAGTYTVTFTLSDAENYCWADSQKDKWGDINAALAPITTNVKRLEIKAPKMNRAAEWTYGADLLPKTNGNADLTKKVTYGGYTVTYEYIYGKLENGNWNDMTADAPVGSETHKRGDVFYVKITATGIEDKNAADFNVYDILWILNTDDTNIGLLTTAGIVTGQYVTPFDTLYLTYTITGQVVQIDAEFAKFTFGDNGYENGTGATKYEIANDLRVNGTTAKSPITFSGSDLSNTTIFNAGSHTVEVKFYTVYTDAVKTEYTDLVNGMPWQAGTYTAVITVKFVTPEGADKAPYEDKPIVKTFEIKAREIRVVWDGAASKEYIGKDQTRSAKIGNVYTKTSGETPEVLSLTTESITNVVWNEAGTAAAEQKIDVTQDFTAEGYTNYTYAAGTQKGGLTITPVALTVTGKQDVTRTYGETLLGNSHNGSGDTTYYTYSGNYYEHGVVTVKIVKDGTAYALDANELKMLDVLDGGYAVQFELANKKGNYTLTATDGKLTIEKRAITITVNTQSITYGEAYDFTQDKWATASNLPTVVNVKWNDIITLKFADSSVNTTYPAANTSGYTLAYDWKAGCANNYTLMFIDTNKFTVNKANLANVNPQAVQNLVYNAAAQAVLRADSLTATTADSGNTVSWYYAVGGDTAPTDDTKYTLIGSDMPTQTNAGTYTYWVKAKADNHNDSTPVKVTVSIAKKQLTVTMALTIYYTESAPNGTAFKTTLGDLTSGTSLTHNGTVYNMYTIGGFADTESVTNLTDLSGAFSYRVENFTGAVGDYTLVFQPDNLQSANYTFGTADIRTANGLHVVALPLTVTVTNKTIEYTENLSADDKANALAFTVETPDSVYGGKVAEPSNIFTLDSTAFIENGDGYRTAKVGDYAITYAFMAGANNNDTNYTVQLGEQKMTVEKAVIPNLFTTSFALSNDKHSTDDPPADHAWKYGASDTPTVKEAVAFTYARDNDASGFNTLQVKLYHKPKDSSVYTQVRSFTATTTDGTYDIAQLLEDIEQLVAGTYKVEIELPETVNYERAYNTWYFSVDTAALTITAVDVEVMYGEDITAATGTYVHNGFAYTVSGLQNGDKLEDVFAVTIKCDYQKGYASGSVGAYIIQTTGLDRGKAGSYKIELNNGTLTVTPRPITVKVDDKTSFYRFIHLLEQPENGNDYKKDAPETLTYTLTGTLGYDDTEADIFALATDAHDGNTTQEVGAYSIYLKKGDHYISKKDSTRFNYTITVEGTKTDIAVGDAILTTGGTYTIEQATVLTSVAPYETSLTYNGQNREYNIVINTGNSGIDTNDVVPSIVYYKRNGENKGEEIGSVAPKDVGDYVVEFTFTNKNYKVRTSSWKYSIKPAEIRLVSSVWTHEKDRVQTVAGGYEYDGGWHTNTLTFTGTVFNEKIGLQITQKHALHAAQTSLAGIDKNTFLKFDYTLNNNVFAYTVTNAGKYAFTFALTNDTATGFIASNYVLADTVTTTYTDTIAMAQLDVVTNRAEVQYGSLLTEAGRFVSYIDTDKVEKFTVTYIVRNNNDGVALLQSDSAAEKGYLKFADGTPWTIDNTQKITYTTDYTPKTSVIDGKYKLALDPACIVAYNFIVTPSGANALTVVKRDVTITVSGYGDDNEKAQTVYKGLNYAGHNDDLAATLAANLNKFLQIKAGDEIAIAQRPTADYSDPLLAVSLNIQGNARNAGIHKMAPSATSNLYVIRFVNAGGETITDSFVDTANTAKLPTYFIDKAPLTIAIGQYNADSVSYAALVKNITVPYGTTLTIASRGSTITSTEATPTFMVRYKGFTDGDDGTEMGPYHAGNNNAATWSFEFEGNAYEAWKSVYNTVFTVKAKCTNASGEALTYDNYRVIYDTATVKVGKLQVTATVADWTYTELTNGDAKNYNGGVSGIGHYVQPSFTYADGSALPVDIAAELNSTTNPLYTVVYANVSNGASLGNAAPTKAGRYTATLTFTSPNYEFAETNRFTYNVNKQAIDVKWAKNGLQITESVTTVENTVANFVNAIMTYPMFTRDNIDIRTLQGIQYTDKGLTITTGIAGTYVLTLEFNANAVVNYCWQDEDGNSVDGQRTLSFTITSTDLSVDFEVRITGWTYGDPANDPTYSLRSHSSGAEITNPNITYAYALAVNIENPKEGALDGVPSGTTFGVTPVNAGWYIVRARFAGSGSYWGADAYYLFRIEQKSVGLPTIDGANGLQYTGNVLTVTATFDRDALGVLSFAYTWSYTNTGARLQVTDAGNYVVTFAVNNANYKWADGIAFTDGFAQAGDNVTYTWTVAKADKNEIVWENELASANMLTVTYGDSYTISAHATYSNAITWSYAEKTTDGYQDITNWDTKRPSNAGTYYVKAVCVGNKNYEDAVDAKILQINKATLTVTPYGSVVYGEDLPSDGRWQASSNPSFGYRLSGFVNGNTGGTVTADLDNIYYQVQNLTGDLVADATFTLTVSVGGFDSPNYTFVGADGTLTVSKKSVTVAIGNLSAPYLTPITDTTLGSVTLRPVGAWQAENVRDLLGVTLSTTAVSNSDVGDYEISAAYTNNNYDVAFVLGTYTVTPLTVYAEWNSGRGGEYNGTIAEASVARVYYYMADGNQNTLLIGVPTFTYVYTGAANDGIPYDGMPTHAGRYTVTAVMDQVGSNYVLDAASAIAEFVVNKQTYTGDFDNLKVEYTGGMRYLTNATSQSLTYDLGRIFDFADGQNVGHTEVGTYTYILVLRDPDNVQWAGYSTAERSVLFEITKATFKPIDDLTIEDWTFGEGAATPTITIPGVNAEDIKFEYATAADGEYTTGVPVNAGTYYVRVFVEGNDNYATFRSAPIAFEVLPKELATPDMVLSDTDTAGVKANTTYTGSQLRAEITGVDGEQVLVLQTSEGCQLRYEDGKMYLVAVNAGTYNITFKVLSSNYAWEKQAQAKALYAARDGQAIEENPKVTYNEDGTLTLSWRVARKAVAKPVPNGKKYTVKSSVLTYIPKGFDADIMEITKNKAGHAGTYYPVITLKDTQNYMWDDGTDGEVILKWRVKGTGTIFAVIMGTLGGAGGALLISAAVMYVLYRKKNKANTPEGGDDGHDEGKASDTQADGKQEVAA